MPQSCVTISLVEEASGGPFIFWHELEAAIRTSRDLGFDAVELFAPSPVAVDTHRLQELLDENSLKLAAVGTGAGWVIQKMHLCHADTTTRENAKMFIRSMIDLGGPFGAPAIIGSMQGRWQEDVDRKTAISHLREALNELGEYAGELNVPLIYEPLNRYETNLCNTLGDGVELLKSLKTDNVKLLADLFHMNIEETDIAAAIREGADHVGHVHFVDSNRRPVGCGHLNFEPIVQALRDINFDGYLSAEAFPWPSEKEAAQTTIEAYRRYFGM